MKDVADQTLKHSIQFVNASIASLADLYKYFEERSKDKKEYEVIKDLYEAYKKRDDAYMVPVKDIAVEDLKKQFDQMGIPNVLGAAVERDLKFFVVRGEDLPMVNYAIEKVLSKGKNISEVNYGVMAKEALRGMPTNPLYKITGLDEIQRKGLLEAARNYGFTISSKYQVESQKYDVYFQEKDKDKVRDAYTKNLTLEIGRSGKRYRQQQTNNLKNIDKILKYASRDTGINEEKNLYIVSPQNIYRNIHIMKNGFEHCIETPSSKRTLRHYEGRGKNIEKQLYRELATIKNPVVLTKDEWDTTKDEATRKKLIQEKSMSIKYKSARDKQLADKEYQMRTLIEAKMSLDNGEQVENLSSFYNGDVGIGEFYEHEIVNYTHLEEEDEKVLKATESLDYQNLSQQDKKDLDQYALQLLTIYKNNHNIEIHYPNEQEIVKSLDELLMDAKIDHIQEDTTREIEEELFR